MQSSCSILLAIVSNPESGDTKTKIGLSDSCTCGHNTPEPSKQSKLPSTEIDARMQKLAGYISLSIVLLTNTNGFDQAL